LAEETKRSKASSQTFIPSVSLTVLRITAYVRDLTEIHREPKIAKSMIKEALPDISRRALWSTCGGNRWEERPGSAVAESRLLQTCRMADN
jgi:hypothetical protein